LKFDNDGWLDAAQGYNISGNSWDRGDVPITHLVIHGTAGGSDGRSTLIYMSNNGVSTHFVISVDGTIWQGVPCHSRAAWGNAPLKAPSLDFARADLNPNLWTVSVEFCKPDNTNQIDITEAQKASGFPLIKAICEQYNIAMRPGDGNSGIISHADINSIDRARCPGTYPWPDLFSFLGSGGDEMLPITIDQVSNYFEQAGDQIWKCKQTGFIIGHGILAFYCAFRVTPQDLGGLTHLGLPKSGEQGVPGKPGVVEQVFERGILAYDTAHIADNPPGSGSVYLAHINTPLPTPVPAPTIDVNKIKAATQEILAAIGGQS